MLVPDHNFVPSTNLPWKIKVTSPMVETQLSLKKPKGISKIHMYISHEMHPRGGGVTPFSTKITPFLYDNTQSTSENHISRPPNVSLAMFRNILNRKSGADVNKSLIRQYLKNYQT